MSNNTDNGLHLETEEILATIVVLALAGFFIWQQLGGNNGARIVYSHPEATVAINPVRPGQNPANSQLRHGRHSDEMASAGAKRPASAAAMQQRLSAAQGCGPGERPNSGRQATGPGECAVERPVFNGSGDGTLTMGSVDEVILGGDSREVTERGPAAGGTEHSQPSDDSSATITSVNFNQGEGLVSLSGKAPADYERVQVIVNGRRLKPVVPDATSSWRQQISAGDEDLYIQLIGVDSQGELIVSEKSMPSVYVLSLKGAKAQQSGVSVMAGQLYQVNPGETVNTLARDFGVNAEMLRKVNGLAGRSLVAGEVLFIPFTTLSE